MKNTTARPRGFSSPWALNLTNLHTITGLRGSAVWFVTGGPLNAEAPEEAIEGAWGRLHRGGMSLSEGRQGSAR